MRKKQSTAERLPAAIAKMSSQLGRRPTQAELGRELGVSGQAVSKAMLRAGMDTGQVLRARSGRAEEKREAQTRALRARKAARETRRDEIVSFVRAHPEMSRAEVGRHFGTSGGRVSALMCCTGDPLRKRLYSSDELAIVGDASIPTAEAARLLGRSYGSVLNKRTRTQHTSGGRSAPSAERLAQILAAFDETGGFTAAARRLGMQQGNVRQIVLAARHAQTLAEAKAYKP